LMRIILVSQRECQRYGRDDVARGD
jgi:hypothetical protein